VPGRLDDLNSTRISSTVRIARCRKGLLS